MIKSISIVIPFYNEKKRIVEPFLVGELNLQNFGDLKQKKTPYNYVSCPYRWTVNPLPLIRWEVGEWCVTTKGHHFKLEITRCVVFKTLTNKNKLVMPLVYTKAVLITSWC